jgi:hypothetical protein
MIGEFSLSLLSPNLSRCFQPAKRQASKSCQLSTGGCRLSSLTRADVPRLEALELLRRQDYSQRNTFAERAMHTANAIAKAAKSPTCANQGSPTHMPSRSDTAYVVGRTRETARRNGGNTASGKNNPEIVSIGYKIAAPIGCAKRAVGTMLAIRNPIDNIAQVLITSATVNETKCS